MVLNCTKFDACTYSSFRGVKTDRIAIFVLHKTSVKFRMLFTKVEFFSPLRSMVNLDLLRAKKYLASYVTAIVMEDPVKSFSSVSKLSLLSSQYLTRKRRFAIFSNLDQNFKNYLVCFHAWFVKLVDKTRLKFVIAYQ